MALHLYRKKRNFGITPEPAGRGHRPSSKNSLIYVIQRHEASHLHYDFRLQIGNVLKSWAVPKGISLTDKRLAVQTEDHPLEYATFEGEIPKDEYGGGSVQIWDHGIWYADQDAAKDWRNGKLGFRLEGKRLNAHFNLVRTHFPGKQPQWLLIPDAKTDRSVKLPSKPRTVTKDVRDVFSRAVPQLATLVDQPPQGAQWLTEVKYDGYRLLCLLDHGEVVIKTRNNNDWTDKFPQLVSALKSLKIQTGIFDGEIAALDDNNLTNFQLLQSYFDDSRAKTKLNFFVFDLLWLNGEDLRSHSMEERREKLKSVFSAPKKKNDLVVLSQELPGPLDRAGAAACKLKLEGLIFKDRKASYEFRRTKTWLKFKCQNNEEFLIVGYTQPKGSRQSFGALLLAEETAKGIYTYRGKVGTGFNSKSLKDILARLQIFEQDEKHERLERYLESNKNVHWVRPELYAQIRFTEKTKDGRLRHPAFLGLREDKAPKVKSTTAIPLSHPDKILFPDEKITKLDLLHYYQAVSKPLLEEILNRPLMLKRCPDGYSKFCFFQKHATGDWGEGLQSLKIKTDGKTNEYIYVQSEKGLESLAQLAVVEIHCWGTKISDIEHPDRLVLDFDPAPGWKWPEFLEQVKAAYRVCQKLGLQAEPRLSGGKGIHMVFAISKLNWDECKTLSKKIAAEIMKSAPEIFLITASKEARRGKIFIDWLRNGRGATAVAAYSPRAREGAPLAMPLSWSQLWKTKSPQDFHLGDFIS